MTYRELGFNGIGIKTITSPSRMTPQEYRNSVQFADVRAKSAFIGSGDNVFKADENGIYLGNATFADAPFRVDMQGNLYASLATIISAITGGTIDIGGEDATSFHVDTNGNMWLGSLLLSGAPFQVSSSGALTAQSVTVKDSGGSTVIDSTGLVSTTQFSSGSQIGTGSQTTGSTDWVDVTGLSKQFSLSRAQNVYLFAQLNAYNDNYLNSYSEARMIIDSTVVGIQASSALTFGIIFAHMQDVASLTSGSHTMKLQVKSTTAPGAGNTVVQLDQCIVGYLTLGK